MQQTEIDIPTTQKVPRSPRVPNTANTLPDIYVGARGLLRNSPWMSSMSLGFVVSFIALLPAVSIWTVRIYGSHKSWVEALSAAPHILEAYRWSLFTALFAFVGFMSFTGFAVAPIATKYSSNKKIRHIGQVLGSLRYNLAFFVASYVTLSVYLSSGLSSPLNEVILKSFIESLPIEAISDSEIKTLSYAYLEYHSSIVQLIMDKRKEFKYIPTLLAVLSTMLLLEKMLILYISHSFHRSFYTKRIKRNNLVLSCFESLSISHPPVGHKPIKPGAVLKQELVGTYAEAIFNGLLKDGRDSLILEDFMEEIDHPIATELFEFLDFNKSGDISRLEFEESMNEAYEEKRMLLKSIKANEKVIDHIDNFFVTIIVLIKISMLIPRMKINLLTFLGYIGGSAFLLRSTLDHLFDQLFGAIMHFLVAHPYDVGDKIQMGHKTYRIKDMGFWKTTLISSDGKVTYVPNHTLFKVKFGNYRRSDKMESNIQMIMSVSTSKEDIQMFMSAMNEVIKENGKYLDEEIVIKEVTIINQDAMSIVFGVTHKFNFNNDENYHNRCELIFSNMARLAKEQNLKYLCLRFQEE